MPTTNSAPLRAAMTAAGESRPPVQVVAGGQQQSPGALALGQLFGLANAQGTMQGGSAGTAGYTISAAPQRAATNAAYQQAEADRSSVYKQTVDNVNAREPGIAKGYDNSIAAIQSQASARDAAQKNIESSHNNDMVSAASRYGLTFNPTTKGLASSNADAQAAKYRTNADSWQGLLSSQKGTAIGNNQRTANAFTYSGTQAQAALQGLLTKALAGMQDKYVAGKAGSAGKMVGGASIKDQIGIYKTILGNQNAQDNATTNKLKAASSMAPTKQIVNKTPTKAGGVQTVTDRFRAALKG